MYKITNSTQVCNVPRPVGCMYQFITYLHRHDFYVHSRLQYVHTGTLDITYINLPYWYRTYLFMLGNKKVWSVTYRVTLFIRTYVPVLYLPERLHTYAALVNPWYPKQFDERCVALSRQYSSSTYYPGNSFCCTRNLMALAACC